MIVISIRIIADLLKVVDKIQLYSFNLASYIMH